MTAQLPLHVMSFDRENFDLEIAHVGPYRLTHEAGGWQLLFPDGRVRSVAVVESQWLLALAAAIELIDAINRDGW